MSFNLKGYKLNVFLKDNNPPISAEVIAIYKDETKPVIFSPYFSLRHAMYFDVLLYNEIFRDVWTDFSGTGLIYISMFNKSLTSEVKRACLLQQQQCLERLYDKNDTVDIRLIEIYKDLVYKYLFEID